MVGKIRAFIEYNLNEGFMFYSKSFLVELIVAFHIGVKHSGNYRNLLSSKKIRQITYSVISLVKMVLSRNFCQKRVRVNFRNFHTV